MNVISTKTSPNLSQMYDMLAQRLAAACQEHYGSRLISVAIYGSVGRGTMHPGSDLDVLIVARDLPKGRRARIEDYMSVESSLAQLLAELRDQDLTVEISPIIKTPAEVRHGSPLFLDMTVDARLLSDREGFLEGELARLSERLQALGSQRIWRGNAWYWDLKPDYQPGDVFEL